MKKPTHPLFMIALFGALFLLTWYGLGADEIKPNTPEQNINFVWNDDIEALPKDGEKIVIEFSIGNTVYLGTIEANQ